MMQLCTISSMDSESYATIPKSKTTSPKSWSLNTEHYNPQIDSWALNPNNT